jgi:hypothetical protein
MTGLFYYLISQIEKKLRFSHLFGVLIFLTSTFLKLYFYKILSISTIIISLGHPFGCPSEIIS